jgi:hypothetical protein
VSKRKTKKQPLYLIRYGDGFIGSTAMDYEEIQRSYPFGPEYKAEPTRPRSVRRNGLYWAILELLHHNNPFDFATKYNIHEATLFDAGHVTPQRHFDGTVVMVPDSTAFDSMDEATNQKYFDKALLIWQEHWGIDIPTMIAEGRRFLTKAKLPNKNESPTNERIQTQDPRNLGSEIIWDENEEEAA